jgi:O-antigen/teichoic acid export membrane protein
MISLRRLASSSALRALDVGVQALATLWITPLLIHSLGKERYGLWITVITLVSYLDLFDLGMTNATSRYVARALGKSDLDAARATARSAFTVLALIGLGCLVLVGLLTIAIPHLLPSAPESLPLKALVLILGCTAALSFPLRVFSGVLEAFVRYEYTTAASLIRTVLSTLALSWVLTHGASLLHMVIVVAASGLLQRALNLIFAQRVLPEMRLLSFQTTRESRRELLGYGAKNFLMKVVDLFRFRIDNVVIANIVSVAAVSLYAPGMAIIRYFREFIECFGAVAMPVFSRAEGAGDRATIRRHLAPRRRLRP